MPKYSSDRPVEELALSSDQTEQAILEYLHDRNFLVGGTSSITLNWTLVDKKAPEVRVVIRREPKPK